MKTKFNESLKFFQENENTEKMSSKKENKSASKTMKNGSGKKKAHHIPCISKELYDEPPQSDFLIAQAFYNILHTTFIILSKIRIGQVLISILDYYMVKIENTLDFCLPDNYEFAAQKVIDKHKRTLPIQDRPMSWLFFIPVLIFLRMLRFALSVYCIMSGKGEVTALLMQAKVIAFRRYYRSIRHYAVNKWTDEDEKLIKERKQRLFWRSYYKIYETIFMTRPIVEFHQENCSLNAEENSMSVKERPNGRDKQSLNAYNNDSDDDLNTNARISGCTNNDYSITVDDTDYVGTGNFDKTYDSVDSDEEESESLRKLNYGNFGENSKTKSKQLSDDGGEHSENDKSNDEDLSPTPSQMNELENEITMKLLKYFKENYNFPPNSSPNEIFYSPIDSPPEREYGSDTEAQKIQQNINSESDQKD